EIRDRLSRRSKISKSFSKLTFELTFEFQIQEIDNASISSSDTVTSCGRQSAPPVIRTPNATGARPSTAGGAGGATHTNRAVSARTPTSSNINTTPRRNSKATSGITPRNSKPRIPKSAVKKTKLDTSIDEVVQSEPFYGGPEIQRVSEGKYRIDGKLMFIRMLKDKHVMVRVGGGWDTLANYLLKHDCQNMVRLPTPTRFV
ncbi:unnamed protein product, partial [Oikopleura dioica]